MQVKRSDIRLYADVKKVIVNYLNLGIPRNSERINRLVKRILAMEETTVENLYEDILQEFAHRHSHFEFFLKLHFEKIQSAIPTGTHLTETRKMLLGAYFTKEYSIQAAALFNPSMVAHPDQTGLAAGEKRFIISLRAVGEGHISSITFRSGIVNAMGDIALDEATAFATCMLLEGAFDPTGTDTNYDLVALEHSVLSERILFPVVRQESNGMEDLRLVAFIENGQSTYIGTYTAYDGHQITPRLLITNDFIRFEIRTLYGKAVNDKGFALFPEKINGQFVMLGRQGGECITIMYSDDLLVWENYQILPVSPSSWALIQLGNCGSPIKTEEGWLVITHGVGALRKYVISAILLDLENPSKIIKELHTPLLSPNEEEREGYVPNVVYSCGSMKHQNLLIIPYAMSDAASTFAVVDIGELLDNMLSCE